MNTYKNIIIKFFMWLSTLVFICSYGLTHALAWTSDGGITYEGISYLTDSTTISIQADYETSGEGTMELLPNSTYYTRIKKLFINVDGYNFIGNRQYQLELHFEGIQLNSNANTYKVYAWNTATLSNDLCMVSYEETIMSNDAYPRWNFQCPTTSPEITIHVYNSNDSAITSTGNFRWSYSYLWYSNQSIGNGNDDIIDNSNQNADRIINNQNENTDKMIESQKVCNTKVLKYSDGVTDGYITTASGTITSSDIYKVTDYIELNQLEILTPWASEYVYSCFYNSDKVLISCVKANQSTGTYSLPSGTKYGRFSIRNTGVPEYKVSLCKDGNQAISDNLKDLNDSITDDSSPDTSGLSNMAGWLPPGPVDSILNLPLTFFNTLNTSLSGSCQTLNVTLPFVNQTLSLPCFSDYMSQHLTNFNTLWTFIGVIASVVILYRYLLALYVWVDDVLMLRYNMHEDFGGNSSNFGGV